MQYRFFSTQNRDFQATKGAKKGAKKGARKKAIIVATDDNPRKIFNKIDPEIRIVRTKTG